LGAAISSSAFFSSGEKYCRNGGHDPPHQLRRGLDVGRRRLPGIQILYLPLSPDFRKRELLRFLADARLARSQDAARRQDDPASRPGRRCFS
jgi:hypothetical protein